MIGNEVLYVESFHKKLRDELLNRELFLHIDELRYVMDRWRMDYNHYRPHSSLGYRSPAAFAATCAPPGSATPRFRDHTLESEDSLIRGNT